MNSIREIGASTWTCTKVGCASTQAAHSATAVCCVSVRVVVRVRGAGAGVGALLTTFSLALLSIAAHLYSCVACVDPFELLDMGDSATIDWFWLSL